MINFITERSRGSRQNLINELNKVDNYCNNKNKISLETIIKLTNLAENYHVSELADICLSKNTKKTAKILNENILSAEDTMLIMRTFLSKTKRLLRIQEAINKNKSIEVAIKDFKPPIFWKDKDAVKQQITKWKLADLKNLMIEINNTELLIKKNSAYSINILSDFILTKSVITSN